MTRRGATAEPSSTPGAHHPVRALLFAAVTFALAACSGAGRAPASTPSRQPAATPRSAPATTPLSAADAAAAAQIPQGWRYPLSSAHPVDGTHGVVVTDDAIASRVGLAILEQGGNAVDAAVATAFALAVVYPQAGNLAGGGFMVVHMANGTSAALDFREKAPLKATRNMYLGPNGQPTDKSITGPLSVGVPGSVAGLWAAHKRFGSLPWTRLLAPAIRLASQGFKVNHNFAVSVARDSARLSRFPASAALFLPGGKPVVEGTTWKDPALADVLRRIRDQGPAGFYKGKTADLIVAQMKRSGGLITHQDLDQYQAKWRDPIRFTYRGNEVISMPPPSSGGITMAETLNILEQWNLHQIGWHSPRELHLMTEAMRRAFADRNHYLGDPDFVSFPQARLISKAYAKQRAAGISLDHATRSADVSPGNVASPEGHNTTNFDVIDAKGDAVALTTTLNDLYGSAVSVAGAGFVLNDEMDDFTSKPGSPNMFGLVQGEANAIAPGKRMLSSMSPTIVLGPDGKVRLVTGARGGPRIITAVLQIISNVVDYDMGIGAAVYAPRIHNQDLPDSLFYEAGGLTQSTIQALEAMGHHMAALRGFVADAPSILRVGDVWQAMPDPREHGVAAGY